MVPSNPNSEVVWKATASNKRAHLVSLIPQEWLIPATLLPPEPQVDITTWPESSGWFTPNELNITNLKASELVERLASGELQCEQVTKAFCKRAAAAHQLANCLSEIVFDRATTTAQARDGHMKRTGTPVGPLHGLPISLKDDFNLHGVDSTLGFVSRIGNPAQSTSTLVRILEDAGAIVYVKTNVSTAMMMAETVNNVFGRTLNPRNLKATIGGSSGGEAALLAMKGSPIGVGSDTAGSLRIPAACAGLFTLRPSAGRFPTRDTSSGIPGQEAIATVNGPFARNLADIELYCKTIINTQPWLRDAKCLPVPWRNVELPKKLKIGIMHHDDMVYPTPPVARALKHVAAKLESIGCELIEWEPENHKQGLSILARMLMADGGINIENELKRTGEPWRPEMKMYENAKEMGTAEMWKLNSERTEYQNRYLDQWRHSGIDAILCPTIPFASTENGKLKHIGYAAIFNVLDYPSISFPTGLSVDKDLDKPNPTYEPLGPTCKVINEEYDPELMHGLPISLQIVAQRLEEEKLIAMTHCVLKSLME